MVPVSQRQHGTRTKYVFDGCRCLPCKAANANYAQWLAKQNAYGRDRLVDADLARERIIQLRDYGIGDRRIAEIAGVERKCIRDIRICDTRRIKPETEKVILAIDVDPERHAADKAFIDATKTWRRIHALEALGYSKTWIAQNAGLGTAIQLPPDRVTARNARKIKALADKVGDTPGTNDRARRRAAQLGYWVPAMYDDDFELPEEEDPDLPTVLQERRAARIAAVRRLTDKGYSAAQIAIRLHISHRQVTRDRGGDVDTEVAS